MSFTAGGLNAACFCSACCMQAQCQGLAGAAAAAGPCLVCQTVTWLHTYSLPSAAYWHIRTTAAGQMIGFVTGLSK